MNSLAYVALGLILGAAILLPSGIGLALLWAVYQQRKTTQAVEKLVQANTQAMRQLKAEVGAGLAKMDADRFFEALLVLQRDSKALKGIIGLLQKLVYARPQQEGLDLAPEIPDEMDQGPEVDGFGNPLAGLSDAEKNSRIHEYFAQRRTTQRGGIRTIGDTPPTPVSGVYAQMIEELKANPPAPKPPADIHGSPGVFSEEEPEES